MKKLTFQDENHRIIVHELPTSPRTYHITVIQDVYHPAHTTTTLTAGNLTEVFNTILDLVTSDGWRRGAGYASPRGAPQTIIYNRARAQRRYKKCP